MMPRKPSNLWCAWLVVGTIAVLLASGSGWAAESEGDLDYGRVFTIQPRAFRMNQEFSAAVGFLPIDAFYKYFAIAGHYVIHFSDLWAWEAVHFAYSNYLSVDTGLRDEMYRNWQAQPTDTPKLLYLLDTNAVFKPFYGKLAVLDSSVIYHETYFLLGVGAEKLATQWATAVDVGIGMRIFVNDRLSLRMEVRDYVYFPQAGPENDIYFGFALCFNAFADERKFIGPRAPTPILTSTAKPEAPAEAKKKEESKSDGAAYETEEEPP